MGVGMSLPQRYCIDINIIFEAIKVSLGVYLISLFISSLPHTIISSHWVGFLQSVILKYFPRIPDSVIVLVGALHFGAPLVQYLYHMSLSVGMRDFCPPFIGLISFCAPLSLCKNCVGFCFTFTLGFPPEELTHLLSLIIYILLDGLV